MTDLIASLRAAVEADRAIAAARSGPVAGRFPLYAVRAILHAAHFRTMAGERVYMATLGNGNVIAWAS